MCKINAKPEKYIWDKEKQNLYKVKVEQTIQSFDNSTNIGHDTNLTGLNSNIGLLLSKLDNILLKPANKIFVKRKTNSNNNNNAKKYFKQKSRKMI